MPHSTTKISLEPQPYGCSLHSGHGSRMLNRRQLTTDLVRLKQNGEVVKRSILKTISFRELNVMRARVGFLESFIWTIFTGTTYSQAHSSNSSFRTAKSCLASWAGELRIVFLGCPPINWAGACEIIAKFVLLFRFTDLIAIFLVFLYEMIDSVF